MSKSIDHAFYDFLFGCFFIFIEMFSSIIWIKIQINRDLNLFFYLPQIQIFTKNSEALYPIRIILTKNTTYQSFVS